MNNIWTSLAAIALAFSFGWMDAVAAGPKASACAPVPGLDLGALADIRFLVFGEMHGTAETPAFVGDVACVLSAKRSVVVAIELPVVDETNTVAFVQSKGAKSDVDRLLHSGAWGGAYQWGATSVAMFELVERVRALRESGRDISVAHFMPINGADLHQNYYEVLMAAELAKVAAKHPKAIVVALMGNIHARKAAIDRGPLKLLPAVAHLPPSDVLSFDTSPGGGAAWNCQPDCGPHPLGSAPEPKPRGVHRAEGAGAFDGVFSVGKHATPSPPAMANVKRL